MYSFPDFQDGILYVLETTSASRARLPQQTPPASLASTMVIAAAAVAAALRLAFFFGAGSNSVLGLLSPVVGTVGNKTFFLCSAATSGSALRFFLPGTAAARLAAYTHSTRTLSVTRPIQTKPRSSLIYLASTLMVNSPHRDSWSCARSIAASRMSVCSADSESDTYACCARSRE